MAPTLQLVLLALTRLLAVQAQFLANLTTVEWRTGNQRVDSLVEQLTPEEKLSLVGGQPDPGNQQQAGYVIPISRLGIPALRLTDGEAGINVVNNATAIPLQLNIGATWSKQVAYDAGLVTGKEAKILGQDVALAPRVNILRDPVLGNFWQSYSEDHFLNAQLGIQGVHGIQDQGSMANAKQIGPSSTGASNGDINSIVDMQTLQEIYWSAPGALLEARASTLMCSYAQINGVPSCQYKPLYDTIRNMYNSSAIVMSDWLATHSTEASITAGMDLEMPISTYYGKPLYDSIYTSKNLSETYLDRAVARILNQYDAFGLLNRNITASVVNKISSQVEVEDAAIAYDIAVKSGVLLKNDKNALPLRCNASIAVIGPNGVQYSHGTNFAERAYGFAEREISPLEALRQRTSKDIPSAVGIDQEGTLIPASALQSLDGSQGLTRNDTSNANATTVDSTVDFSGANALPANRSFQWTGSLIAPESGIYTISLQREMPSADGKDNADLGFTTFAVGSISINGSSVAEGYRLLGDGGARPWSNSITTRDGWDNIKATVYLSAGVHDISASIVGLLQEPVSVRLCWVTPSQRETNIQAAVSLASTVDTPLVFAFANSPAQVAMTLDDSQDELIERVVAANPKTIVILNNAEPVTMPWLSPVPAVLEMFYPGQEGGFATADLLLGNKSPAGRLPITYPTSVNTSVTRNPAYPERVSTASGNATFPEGVNAGYRWYTYTNTSVLFPFGYGLSYTNFSFSNLSICTCNSLTTASFHVTNTGSKAGNAIPQLYLGPPSGHSYNSTVQFASIALAGFENVDLAPGESKAVKIPIAKRSLSFYNVMTEEWELVKGERSLWVGSNAQDLVLQGKMVS